jgi:hypothetical protein
MGKQIVSIRRQGFFYADMILIRNIIISIGEYQMELRHIPKGVGPSDLG